jgi:tripartite-type tricarboxylate transporter receptor subunit TctC
MRPSIRCAAIFVLAALLQSPAWAQSAADFFAGRQMRIIVGTPAGGGYDAFARLAARHLGNHLPGRPHFVVENMPGASGTKAVNYLYSAAPADGSVLATFNDAIPFYQATGQPGIAFRSELLSWVGSLTQTASVVSVWHTSGVRNIDDAKRVELLMGATGAAGTKSGFPALLNRFLGTKFRIVNGYDGSSAVTLAIERGEVQGDGSNPWSTWKTTRPDWVAQRLIVPILQIGIKKDADLMDVPLLSDITSDEETRRVFEFAAAPVAMRQPFAGPPGIPADRLAILRTGFQRMTRDPAFLADATKSNLDIDAASGAEVELVVRRTVQTSADIIRSAQEAMAAKTNTR